VVAAHYNGARYVPEHVRPNPTPHRRRPPAAHSNPAIRKQQILDLLSHHSEGIQPHDLRPLAKRYGDHLKHWTNTLRGLVRYKHVVKTFHGANPVYLLPKDTPSQ